MTSNNHKIIFGIPTYNGAPTIRRTFESLYESVKYCEKRLNCDVRIIFVLNGCTDNTRLVVQKIINDFLGANLEFFEMSKGSKPAAVNFLKRFDAELIGYVDDDVTFELASIYKSVNAFNNKNVWATYLHPFPMPPKKDSSLWRKLVYNALTMRTNYGLLLKKYDLLIGRCVLMRKEKMIDIPEHIINEDQYLDYLLYPHVYKIDAFVYYEGVYTLRNNFIRDVRISAGRIQAKRELPSHVIESIDSGRQSSINYKKLFNLGPKVIFLYIIYRTIYRFSKFFVKIYLSINPNPQWQRTY